MINAAKKEITIRTRISLIHSKIKLKINMNGLNENIINETILAQNRIANDQPTTTKPVTHNDIINNFITFILNFPPLLLLRLYMNRCIF